MNGIKCQTEEFLLDPLAMVSQRWTFFFFFFTGVKMSGVHSR